MTPAQLRNIGQDHLAELVEQRMSLLEPESEGLEDLDDAMEAHLLNTPGLSDGQCAAIMAVAREFRRSGY